MTRLCREGHSRWPAFAAELERQSGTCVELRSDGALTLLPEQRRLSGVELLPPLELVSATELRKREPRLAPGLAGAIFDPTARQVDNRRVMTALYRAASAAGVQIREHQPVIRLAISGRRLAHVLVGSGEKVSADLFVLAAGTWSYDLAGLADEARPPVRPIKGQILALRMDPAAPLLRHIVLTAPMARQYSAQVLSRA